MGLLTQALVSGARRKLITDICSMARISSSIVDEVSFQVQCWKDAAVGRINQKNSNREFKNINPVPDVSEEEEARAFAELTKYIDFKTTENVLCMSSPSYSWSCY